MKISNMYFRRGISSAAVLLFSVAFIGCSEQEKKADTSIKRLDPARAAEMAKAIEATVTPQLAEGLTLKIWGVDSLIADPVSIDIDDNGHLYYTRTNRQKNSEFDIRGHQDWEIESIKLKNIEEKRAFLRKTLSPENSDKNTWLADLNGDGSRDWRDLTIEKEHVYRVEDTSGDGVADLSQLVIKDFHDEVTDAAGGVLKHGDNLYVGIGPDLWLTKDEDGDGVIDKKTSISHGYGIHVGFSGHGMSGIEVGPEGRIYWQIGDIGFSGEGPDGQKWDHANSGVIVRANPDGSDFEVFAYGNRNTHEFVFDEYGNLISEDNDGDHRGESERIVYVVNGADIGWRINWQFGKYRDPENNTYKVWMDEKLYIPRFEGQAAYITPAIANFVNGPTGMLYNPGTALSPEWRNTFFIAEFVGNPAQSGIHAFKLKPKGATFELGEHKKMLGGVLATGIDFAPDGSMLVADWIDGWNTKDFGRIWKLDAANPDPERKEVERLIRDDFKKYKSEQLGELLKNADMRVRQKAQFELASRKGEGMEIFKKAISQREHQLARVNAIWGISQLARLVDIKYAGELVPLLDDSDPEIRAQAAKWIGDVRYKDAGDKLIALLKDDYSRARFFAAEALGRIAYGPAVNPLVGLLEANNDEDAYLRHAASLALARIGNADAVAALSTHPSAAVRLGAVVALRRMQAPGIANFLDDVNEYVVTEAARAINDDHSIEAALPALGNILNRTPFANEPLIRRAINANFRTGTQEGIQNLVTFARNQKNSAAMRAEAIAALSTWVKPSVLDRVDGRYRGEVQRDPQIILTAAGSALVELCGANNAEVRLAATKAVGKLRIRDASSALFARLSQDPDHSVRAEALKSIAAINDPRTGDAVQTALRDREKQVRVIALDLLTMSNLPQDRMATLLEEVVNTRTVEEKQQALLTLGTLSLERTKPVFERLLTKLESGKLPVEINLELAEAIDSTKSAELQDRFRKANAEEGKSVLASFQGALLGGDENRGSRIFYSHQTAQCIRCHVVGDYGGNAGPPLTNIASKLSREELLQALVEPSARLAPGYGMVTVELNNGKKLSGILQGEDKQKLSVKIGDRPDTVIQVSDIRSKTYGQSSMPPMNLLLTKREIRDLVSFISTLKE